MRKKMLKILLLIITTILISCSYMLPVFAADPVCPLCTGPHDASSISGKIQKAGYEIACTVYGGDLFDANDTSQFSVSNVLKFNVSEEGSAFKSIFNGCFNG